MFQPCLPDWRNLPETCLLRDLWEPKWVGAVKAGYRFHIDPHGSGLYRVSPVPERENAPR